MPEEQRGARAREHDEERSKGPVEKQFFSCLSFFLARLTRERQSRESIFSILFPFFLDFLRPCATESRHQQRQRVEFDRVELAGEREEALRRGRGVEEKREHCFVDGKTSSTSEIAENQLFFNFSREKIGRASPRLGTPSTSRPRNGSIAIPRTKKKERTKRGTTRTGWRP